MEGRRYNDACPTRLVFKSWVRFFRGRRRKASCLPIVLLFIDLNYLKGEELIENLVLDRTKVRHIYRSYRAFLDRDSIAVPRFWIASPLTLGRSIENR